MKSRTQTVLTIMHILAWLAFAGFFIKAGAILTSYVVSINNPVGAKNLYLGWNMYALRQNDFWEYTGMMSLAVAVAALEIYTTWLLIRIFMRIKMTSPFTMEVAKLLEKMSWLIILTWVAVIISNSHGSWLLKKIPGWDFHETSTDFVFYAGIVFVIAQIFKKGVELQTENDLTV